jgi:hypothetical protein
VKRVAEKVSARRDQSNASVAVYALSEVALHMTSQLDRREFIQLAGLATAGVAGVVFSSGLRGVSLAAEKGRAEDSRCPTCTGASRGRR